MVAATEAQQAAVVVEYRRLGMREARPCGAWKAKGRFWAFS